MDNRIGTFEHKGIIYPTIASARALQNITEKYNLRIERFFETYDPQNLESVVFILSELLKAGHAWATYEGEAAPVPPSYDVLMDTFTFTEVAMANVTILETMARSMGRKINAEKKHAAAPDPAENS